MTGPEFAPGVVAWAALGPVPGRERGRHGPVLIAASAGIPDAVTTLAIVLPITTTVPTWLGDFLDL